MALIGLQLPGHSPKLTLKNTNKTHLIFPNSLGDAQGGPCEAQHSALYHMQKRFSIAAGVFLGGDQRQHLYINIIRRLEGEPLEAEAATSQLSC